MTMEEYKQLEDAKNNYESLKREIRDIDFAEDGDINKIKFKNIKGEK